MKLTPWFDHTTPPARLGVYEVRLGVYEPPRALVALKAQTQKWYAYWNGHDFRLSTGDIPFAYRVRHQSEHSDLRAAQWRGLAEDPKA